MLATYRVAEGAGPHIAHHLAVSIGHPPVAQKRRGVGRGPTLVVPKLKSQGVGPRPLTVNHVVRYSVDRRAYSYRYARISERGPVKPMREARRSRRRREGFKGVCFCVYPHPRRPCESVRQRERNSERQADSERQTQRERQGESKNGTERESLAAAATTTDGQTARDAPEARPEQLPRACEAALTPCTGEYRSRQRVR